MSDKQENMMTEPALMPDSMMPSSGGSRPSGHCRSCADLRRQLADAEAAACRAVENQQLLQVQVVDLAQEREATMCQLARLRAVVDRIPKLKDGTPALPGYEVRHPDETIVGVVRWHDWEERDDADGVEFDYQDDGNRWSYRPVGECYPTPETAEAAKTPRGPSVRIHVDASTAGPPSGEGTQ